MTVSNRSLKTHHIKKKATKREILFNISSALSDVGYTSRTAYLSLKCRFQRTHLVTGNTESIDKRVKLSRFQFKLYNNTAILNGFYRAVW